MKRTYLPKGFTIIETINNKYLVKSQIGYNIRGGEYSLYYSMSNDLNGNFHSWVKSEGKLVINPEYVVCERIN